MAIAGAALVVPCRPAGALDRVELTAPGADRALLDRLRAASLTIAAERDKTTDSQTIFAAARADYARLIGALYAEGYYSGVIQILIDGREAAEIAPLDTPESIGVVSIRVTPGPIFRFERARMRPYARGTRLPPAYGDTRPAYSTAIVDAAEAAGRHPEARQAVLRLLVRFALCPGGPGLRHRRRWPWRGRYERPAFCGLRRHGLDLLDKQALLHEYACIALSSSTPESRRAAHARDRAARTASSCMRVYPSVHHKIN